MLAAATTGSGLRFRANSKELIARYPGLDGGIGHCYLGAFCAPPLQPRDPRSAARATLQPSALQPSALQPSQRRPCDPQSTCNRRLDHLSLPLPCARVEAPSHLVRPLHPLT